METKKSIQISYVILMIMMIIALVYAALAFAQPNLLVSRSFTLYTGISWNDFLNTSPIHAHYMLILERMAGGLGFALSLGGIIVLIAIYRKGVKWAWYYILVVGIIGWVNNLVANIMFKNSLIIIVIVVGLVLITVGLIIPAKDFLGEKKSNT
jgi:hypothetical protein